MELLVCMAMFQGFMVNNYNKRRFHTLHHIFKDWPATSSSLLKSTFFSNLWGREMYARGCCVFVVHNEMIRRKKSIFNGQCIVCLKDKNQCFLKFF